MLAGGGRGRFRTEGRGRVSEGTAGGGDRGRGAPLPPGPVIRVDLDVEAVRRRVRGALEGRHRRVAEPDDRLPAAVLLLIVYHGDEPHLVFTKKTDTVPHHKGQFAFPGGLVATRDVIR